MRDVPRLVSSAALFLVVSHVIVPMKARLYADAGTCSYYGSAYKYDYGNNFLGHYGGEDEASVDNCTSRGQGAALSDCATVCGGVSQHGVAYCCVYWDLFEDGQGLGHVQQQYECADVR